MLNAIEDIIMVNKINDSVSLKPIEIDSRLKTKSQETKGPIVGNAPSSQDSVNFSDTSKQLEALKASFANAPEVDSVRVSHFKNEIASGNYQINSAQIAKNMSGAILETA